MLPILLVRELTYFIFIELLACDLLVACDEPLDESARETAGPGLANENSVEPDNICLFNPLYTAS